MQLLEVHSATKHVSGAIDMQIRVEVDGVEKSLPFSYCPGDPYGLGPAIDRWWAEHPDFPVESAPAPEISPDAVKAEAARRIDLIMKDYEQRNALALGQEMVLTYGPDATKWPADKQGTLSAIMGKWAAIKVIRAKSDDIETMSPIPADYADDKYWA